MNTGYKCQPRGDLGLADLPESFASIASQNNLTGKFYKALVQPRKVTLVMVYERDPCAALPGQPFILGDLKKLFQKLLFWFASTDLSHFDLSVHNAHQLFGLICNRVCIRERNDLGSHTMQRFPQNLFKILPCEFWGCWQIFFCSCLLHVSFPYLHRVSSPSVQI